ncbi:MAG: excinuclease ABC subunit UvrC [Candidatus Nanoarchaeia archaeon]|nr:excinuclease ABC subunit UvrC [Candidatus Nanoarchaeia archaeon]
MIDLSALPNSPGCYLYKDINGKIIYVGKAGNLKKRVESYFKGRLFDNKTKALVNNINGIDFIITNNEIEALILENNLIKKHNPKYNIALKDSKTYSFIKLTDDKFPRLVMARDREKGEDLFGPFVLAGNRKNILEFANKTFKLRTCKRMPKKECLRFHIGLCSAPCIGKISKKDYADQINKARNLLIGKNESIESALKKELKEYSMKKEFEKAIIVREQLKAVDYLRESQLIQRNKKHNEHFIDFLDNDNGIYIMVFKVNSGLVSEKDEFEFNYSPDFFNQFLMQYYSENSLPEELVLRQKIDSALVEHLKGKSSAIKIIVPKKGDKLKMLDLIKKNIEQKFLKNALALNELKTALFLEKNPLIIEGFDISHLAGTDTTASMVQFKNGEPNKSEYRRFKIKTLSNEVDDFKAMKEVVLRRYERILLENKSLPDLILVDGGLGQVSSASKALKKLSIEIPIIGLAKKFEEIWLLNKGAPIIMDKKSEALKLLLRVRDESHRFAKNYNKLLRSKRLK